MNKEKKVKEKYELIIYPKIDESNFCHTKDGIYDHKYMLVTNSNSLSSIIKKDDIEISKIDIYLPLYLKDAYNDDKISYNAMELINKFHNEKSKTTFYASGDSWDNALNNWMSHYYKEKFQQFPVDSLIKLVSPEELLYVGKNEKDKLLTLGVKIGMDFINGNIMQTKDMLIS